MSIEEKDFARLTELLTMKKTVPLDLTRGGLPEEIGDEIEESIQLNFMNKFEYFGNLSSAYMMNVLAELDEKAELEFWKNRFKVVKDDNGNPALEVSFIPAEPFEFDTDDNSEFFAHVDAIWNNTRLSEIMDYDTYLAEMTEGSYEWIYECFGEGGECYGVMVEVVPDGFEPGGIMNYDNVFELPITFEYDGIHYEMRVATWSD